MDILLMIKLLQALRKQLSLLGLVLTNELGMWRFKGQHY